MCASVCPTHTWTHTRTHTQKHTASEIKCTHAHCWRKTARRSRGLVFDFARTVPLIRSPIPFEPSLSPLSVPNQSPTRLLSATPNAMSKPRIASADGVSDLQAVPSDTSLPA
eukprot:441944-Rhodomonas_salina.2